MPHLPVSHGSWRSTNSKWGIWTLPAPTSPKSATLLNKSNEDNRWAFLLPVLQGRLALLEGNARVALRHYKVALAQSRKHGAASAAMNALARVGQVHLAVENPRAALTATRRATAMHRAHKLEALEGLDAPLVWWRHSQALQANGRRQSAREALEMAYQFMLKGIAGLSDEGLRRNYLNKSETHREIVAAWLKDARKRRLSPERRAAHLARRSESARALRAPGRHRDCA